MEKVKQFFKLNIATTKLCSITENHPQKNESLEALPQFEKALKILEACEWKMPKTNSSELLIDFLSKYERFSNDRELGDIDIEFINSYLKATYSG